MSRSDEEIQTVDRMIGLYCRDHHEGPAPCAACRELADYAHRRTRACPFGDGKPACSRCRIHCYRPEMKSRIREVMRYAGPKMIWRHPVLALRHLLTTGRKPPER